MQEIFPDGARGILEPFDGDKITERIKEDADTSFEIFKDRKAGLRARGRRYAFMTPNQRKAVRRARKNSRKARRKNR